MRLFPTLLLLFSLTSFASALWCLRYATQVQGSMDDYSPAWVYVKGLFNGNYGVTTKVWCQTGEVCVAEGYMYHHPDGKKSGFVYGSCMPQGNLIMNECERGRIGEKSYNSEIKEEVYRCACDCSDYCISVEHMHAMWDEAYKGIKNLKLGPKNPYVIAGPYLEV